jgi:hypothetical protein|tara:strand:+ start:41 stop:316 length:276 start_codon:yes stop_codon:yes gene_type:complete
MEGYKMKKQWAIIDKKTNHRIGVYSSKEEAEAMIEKYMHKDEMQVEEHIPFEGNEGIYARGDVGIGRTLETKRAEEQAEKIRFGQMMSDVA